MSDDESESGSDASEGTPDYLSAKIKPHMDAVQPQVKLALQSIVSLYRTRQVIVSHLQTMSHSSKHLGEKIHKQIITLHVFSDCQGEFCHQESCEKKQGNYS